MPQFDPSIVVLALSAIESGSIVRWKDDRYCFCARSDDDPDTRCLILHNAESGAFEYLGSEEVFVVAHDKEELIIKPSLDSFQPDMSPSSRSTGELYIRDGLPMIIVRMGNDPHRLLALDSGTIEAFDRDGLMPMCGFTAWSIGVWQSDGEFLSLMDLDAEYGHSDDDSFDEEDE